MGKEKRNLLEKMKKKKHGGNFPEKGKSEKQKVSRKGKFPFSGGDRDRTWPGDRARRAFPARERGLVVPHNANINIDQ
jgi:hypothetical protein